MEIVALTSLDNQWNKVSSYAKKCSWRAGDLLAQMMNNNEFTDWERVIVALENDNICGYCTIAKKDCIPDVDYTPYIGFIFVDEKYRGNRLSEQLIRYAQKLLQEVGFDRVHIVSDHINLYEKFGFHIIARKISPWGSEEKIYMQKL